MAAVAADRSRASPLVFPAPEVGSPGDSSLALHRGRDRPGRRRSAPTTGNTSRSLLRASALKYTAVDQDPLFAIFEEVTGAGDFPGRSKALPRKRHHSSRSGQILLKIPGICAPNHSTVWCDGHGVFRSTETRGRRRTQSSGGYGTWLPTRKRDQQDPHGDQGPDVFAVLDDELAHRQQHAEIPDADDDQPLRTLHESRRWVWSDGIHRIVSRSVIWAGRREYIPKMSGGGRSGRGPMSTSESTANSMPAILPRRARSRHNGSAKSSASGRIGTETGRPARTGVPPGAGGGHQLFGGRRSVIIVCVVGVGSRHRLRSENGPASTGCCRSTRDDSNPPVNESWPGLFFVGATSHCSSTRVGPGLGSIGCAGKEGATSDSAPR